MPPPPAKAYIVILNFRAPDDTAACLLSLNGLTHRAFETVVVDNGSGDGSLERIKTKIDGRTNYPLHFLQRSDNGGFAAGNNEGLRFALARGDGRYFWVLNNDAAATPDALTALVRAAEEDAAAGRKIGQYGSKLLYQDRPDVIQAVGGTYEKWLGITAEIGNGEQDGPRDWPRPDILIGASLFVTEGFLKDVGLMSEDYFLYYEEHDWAERGRRKGWDLRVVPESVVYHRQGAAIGALGGNKDKKSVLSDFYAFRNKLLFTARYHPWCLPTVYLGFAGMAWRRVRRGQWGRLPLMLRLMLTFFLKPLMKP